VCEKRRELYLWRELPVKTGDAVTSARLEE